MPHRRGLPGFLVLAFLFLLPIAAQAALGGDAAFVVRGVEVDVRADSAAQARERAFAIGQYRAFQKLMARLVPDSAREMVPELEVAQIVPMIRDVGVAEEKASSVRYIASLSVRFKRDAVRDFLRGAGIPYAEPRDEPLLVLPVFAGADGPVLWGDPNPWRDAWAGEGAGGGLVPLLTPLGELADLAAISAEQALMMDANALQAIAARYGGKDVMVAMARLDAAEGEPPRLVVDLSGFGPTVPRAVRRLRLAGSETEAAGALLARGVEAVAAAIDEAYKAGNIIAADRGGSLIVSAPLGGLEAWLDLRRKLDRLDLLNGYHVRSLSVTGVEMVLDYVGETPHLVDALAERGLVLDMGRDGRWILRRERERTGLR